MRTVIARIFDYSLDGIVAEEGTSFFDFCRDLPDDPTQLAHGVRLWGLEPLIRRRGVPL
jgi:hypothetical protein